MDKAMLGTKNRGLQRTHTLPPGAPEKQNQTADDKFHALPQATRWRKGLREEFLMRLTPEMRLLQMTVTGGGVSQLEEELKGTRGV